MVWAVRERLIPDGVVGLNNEALRASIGFERG